MRFIFLCGRWLGFCAYYREARLAVLDEAHTHWQKLTGVQRTGKNYRVSTILTGKCPLRLANYDFRCIAGGSAPPGTQGRQMQERGAYGRRLGDIFRLEQAPAFVTRTLRKTVIAVTHIKCDRVNNGMTVPIPREDAILFTMQLRDCPRHELWLDDRPVPTGHLRPGMISIYDLRRNPIANSVSPFEALHFYVPRPALDAIADMEGCVRIDEFNNQPGVATEDPVIQGLGLALIPAFERCAEASGLFVDHLTTAAAAHVLRNYGTGVRPAPLFFGKLAPWQQRRVTDVLSSRLDGDVSTTRLAQECGLSISGFSRAFRTTMGMTPQRWLLRHRIDTARALLRSQSRATLEEIALACGFASKSHLARAFKQITGSHLGDLATSLEQSPGPLEKP